MQLVNPKQLGLAPAEFSNAIGPVQIASKVMIWLFGVWVLGMLLAPFSKERTILKKVTEYGALVALGTLLTAHFIPFLQEYESSYTVGMMVTSVLSLFGAGRDK